MKTMFGPLLISAALLPSATSTIAAEPAKPAAAAMSLADATVKKVDKAAGKVTLSHGPIANLDMPPMTMVFRVKDAAWLEKMKAGDKIRFMAEQLGSTYTVVHFEAAP